MRNGTIPDDLARFRERLLAEIAQQADAAAQAGQAALTVELDQSSVGRLSRMDAMQQQAMAKNRQVRLAERLRKVAAAISRMDAGTYGLCCQCRDRIETVRLEADPATVFCTACAEQRGMK